MARPSARIVVLERENAVASSGHACRDELDICYNSEVLSAFFFRRPSDRVVDLMRIAASVAHADRRITRRPSICWGRDFEIDVPVSDPDFWSDEPNAKLAQLLGLLSGDAWSFRFRKQVSRIQIPSQRDLEFPTNGELAIAYSDGLDSFAVSRLVASGAVNLTDGFQGKRDIVLVTTGRKINAELKRSLTVFGYSARQVSVPFKISRYGDGFQLRETSYRTRAFVFQTLAALAAAESEGNTVIMSESGQGSLGPWLTVTGQEMPDLRSHPLFTLELSRFLKLVLDRDIKFEHPQLWETKGQTIRRLIDNRLHADWERTFSCAVQVRHQKNVGRRLHCGVCPNCFLRRQSLLNAGLEECDSKYDYQCMPRARDDEAEGADLKKRIAQGLLPLIDLAQVRATPLLARTTERRLTAFARRVGKDPGEVSRRTDTLLAMHREELTNFLARQPNGSLVRELGEALS